MARKIEGWSGGEIEALYQLVSSNSGRGLTRNQLKDMDSFLDALEKTGEMKIINGRDSLIVGDKFMDDYIIFDEKIYSTITKMLESASGLMATRNARKRMLSLFDTWENIPIVKTVN